MSSLHTKKKKQPTSYVTYFRSMKIKTYWMKLKKLSYTLLHWVFNYLYNTSTIMEKISLKCQDSELGNIRRIRLKVYVCLDSRTVPILLSTELGVNSD